VCLFSFLPVLKSRQGWALQLSNTSIKIRIRKGKLDPKEKLHQAKKKCQEKENRRLYQRDAMVTVTNTENKDILTSPLLQGKSTMEDNSRLRKGLLQQLYFVCRHG